MQIGRDWVYANRANVREDTGRVTTMRKSGIEKKNWSPETGSTRETELCLSLSLSLSFFLHKRAHTYACTNAATR